MVACSLVVGNSFFEVGLRFLREDEEEVLRDCVVAKALGAAVPFECESCESPLIKAIKDYTA